MDWRYYECMNLFHYVVTLHHLNPCLPYYSYRCLNLWHMKRTINRLALFHQYVITSDMNLPWWLKLSKSTFNSSLSKSLLGDDPPFIDLKYWLHRVRPASFLSRFSFARLFMRKERKFSLDFEFDELKAIYHTDFETTLAQLSCRVRCLVTIVHVRVAQVLGCCCKHF